MQNAYDIGVSLALKEAGLIKEAKGQAAAGLKALLAGPGRAAKEYLTAAPLRKSLAATGRVSKGLARTEQQFNTLLERLGRIQAKGKTVPPELVGAIKRKGQQLNIVRERLTTAKGRALSDVVPYAMPPAIAGAGYGGYRGLKALFPKAFGGD